MIKNIILDVGKVLVQWEPKTAMEKLRLTEKEIKAVSAALFESGKWIEEDRGVLSDEELLESFFEEAPEYKEQIKKFWDNVDMAIWQFDYVKTWILAMKQAGYKIYILSNYGRHTFEKTKDTGLDFLSLTDGNIFSYTIQKIKPDEAIYMALCEKYGLIPEECVFLDDLPANIEGAKRVGMQGIIFTGLEDAIKELYKLGVELEL